MWLGGGGVCLAGDKMWNFDSDPSGLNLSVSRKQDYNWQSSRVSTSSVRIAYMPMSVCVMCPSCNIIHHHYHNSIRGSEAATKPLIHWGAKRGLPELTPTQTVFTAKSKTQFLHLAQGGTVFHRSIILSWSESKSTCIRKMLITENDLNSSNQSFLAI